MLNISLRSISEGIKEAALFRAPGDIFAFLQMEVIWSLKFEF